VFELRGIWRALAGALAVRVAPPRKRSDAGPPFVIDDVIRIASRILRTAVLAHEAGQLEPRTEVEQHVLEGPHVAVGLHHRLPDRIGGAPPPGPPARRQPGRSPPP